MSPAAPRIALLAAIVFTSACEDRTPVAPSPSPSVSSRDLPTPSAMFLLTGTVYESTREGRRPLAGMPLDISVEYQSWPPRATTDADGRYRFSASSSETLHVRAEKEGYSQPCRSAVALIKDTVVDVYVVADATLSANGVPASMPVSQPTLQGTVFERTAGDVRPVQGVKVTGDFSAGLGWAPNATTVTDAAGRYLLCGLGGDIGLELMVQRPGQPNRFVPVDIRTTTTLDIELAAR
jgi:hypothetical protein